MLEKDDIQELLREKLQSHEVTPPDSVWQNVSNSISSAPASAGSAASGSSLLVKVAAVVVGASSIGVAAYFILNNDDSTAKKEIQTISTPKIEGAEPEDVEKGVSIDLKLEKSDVAVANENSNRSEGIKTLESEAVSEKGKSLKNEDLVNLPTRNTASVINLAPIPDTSPEDVDTETTTFVPATPVPETADADETPIETVVENENATQNQVIKEAVEEIQIPVEVEETIVLPNIFTPNNDGVNDFFEIEIGEKLDFQIVVIDQTNKVVFQSQLVDFRWDGTLPGGEPVPSGNYIYYLTAKSKSGKDVIKHSDLRIEH
jgi:gliding motility-associated-like protein